MRVEERLLADRSSLKGKRESSSRERGKSVEGRQAAYDFLLAANELVESKSRQG